MKSAALHLNKLESPLPMDALCAKLLCAVVLEGKIINDVKTLKQMDKIEAIGKNTFSSGEV